MFFSAFDGHWPWGSKPIPAATYNETVMLLLFWLI